MIGMMNAMRAVTGVGTAAVLAGLAVSFVAATGYRPRKGDRRGSQEALDA